MSVLLKWKNGPTYDKPTRIDGKIVLITGCNTGIGKETALELAKRGGHIHMACRDFDKCEKARLEIIEQSGNTHIYNRILDLSSLQSVRDFAEKFNREVARLDILINNAGICYTPFKLTVDGIEQQFEVNFLGHFLLTNLLMAKLKSSAPSRIVVLSSIAHRIGKLRLNGINNEKEYSRLNGYARSKLANILYTRKLAELLKGTRVTANCLHPGCVKTDLCRHHAVLNYMKSVCGTIFLKSPKGGAQTSIFAAIDPDIEGESGNYYDSMKLGKLSNAAQDDDLAQRLWMESEKMVGINKNK